VHEGDPRTGVPDGADRQPFVRVGCVAHPAIPPESVGAGA
jgi:hypothetical protein